MRAAAALAPTTMPGIEGSLGLWTPISDPGYAVSAPRVQEDRPCTGLSQRAHCLWPALSSGWRHPNGCTLNPYRRARPNNRSAFDLRKVLDTLVEIRGPTFRAIEHGNPVVWGSTSLSSSRCLPNKVCVSTARPVRFPSGRESDFTQPERTGSTPPSITTGMAEVARSAPAIENGGGEERSHVEPNEIGREFVEAGGVTPPEAPFDYEVSAVLPAVLHKAVKQGFPERHHCGLGRRHLQENADTGHGLLSPSGIGAKQLLLLRPPAIPAAS